MLHAGEFANEQEYESRKLQLLNREIYGFGIVNGLQTEEAEGGKLFVRAGDAVDRQGRMIRIPWNVLVSPDSLNGLPEVDTKDFILGIRYEEKAVDMENVNIC